MNRRARAGLVGFFLGDLFLWALFVPAYGDRGLTIDARPPVVLFAVLLLLGFVGQMRWTLRSWLRGLLAIVVLLLALLQVVSAAVVRILDRSLDLYFDIWVAYC